MKAVDRLKLLAYQKKIEEFPSVPIHAVPKPKYNDKDTNALTRCVMDWISLNGGYSVRINVQGQYDERRKIWRKSQTERGTADIHSCISGKHVSIEIKFGKDRQSDDQKRVQEKVEASGGVYLIVKTFEDFLNWWDSNT